MLRWIILVSIGNYGHKYTFSVEVSCNLFLFVYLHYNLQHKIYFSKDSLQILDGDNKNAPPIYDELCGPLIPNPVTSSGSSMLIRFRSSSGGENTNYEINIKNGEIFFAVVKITL